MSEIKDISKRLISDCLGVKAGETFLVITDDIKEDLAKSLYEAAGEIGLTSMLFKIPVMKRSGEEPPKAAAEAMKNADVVVCITEHSLTHTQAKKEAAKAGARIATMPGITKDMFLKGAITADYTKVEELTKKVTQILTSGSKIVIEKDGHKLEMSIEGRNGVESTGRYLKKGQTGNLPSGEAYIAPLEGSATGSIFVDGSIVGIGKLKSPITLTIDKGLLIDAKGYEAKEWLDILEDEKILGTVHVAFGSNNTFGGNVSAGVHLDAVILNPTVFIDGMLILDKGRLVIL